MKTTLPALFFMMVITPFAWGQIPQTMSYQGELSDASNDPVPDGNYNVTFRLYEVSTDGAAIWEEAQLVATANGLFNVILGSVVPLELPFDNTYWLGVTVGAESELTPRVQLTSSAYSLNAANSVKAGGFAVSATPVANNLLPLDAGGKLPEDVLPEIPTTMMGGVKNTGSVTIDATTTFEILSFTIDEPGTFNVSLAAHLVAEINGDGAGRYEFNIVRGSIGGTSIGKGWWRPGSSAGHQAVTIAFNGVDTDVSGPVTYYLVGKKFDSSALDVLVFISGLNAIWIAQ